MKLKRKLGCAGIIAAVVAVFWWMIYDMESEMCGNGFISAQPSPDGTLKAVTFERDCGAATRCSTQISILPINSRLENEMGNAFETWDESNLIPIGSWGGPITHLTWINNRQVEIRHDPRAESWRADKVTVKEGWRVIATVDVFEVPEESQPTTEPDPSSH